MKRFLMWASWATWAALAMLAGPAVAAGPVTGFIVQLRAEPGALANAGADVVADVSGGAGADAGLKQAQAVPHAGLPPLAVGRAMGGRWHRLLLPAAPAGESARSTEARLRADPRVLSVVPDVREQRQDVTPADPRFAAQWWLQAVAAGNTGVSGFAKAWQRSTGVAHRANPGVVVAVLDSGITSHIETNARLLPGYDFVADSVYAADGNGRDNDPADPGDAVTAADRLALPDKFGGCPDALRSSWHGSTIAGQLAAVSNNTEGGAAANWQSLVLPVRVAGKCGAAVSDIIDGLRWAAGLAVAGAPANPNPARLIVLSYGGVDACDRNNATPAIADTARLYESALAEVRAAGALVFVAAGNQRGSVGRPASCAGAFAVASVNREGFKAGYSNFGPAVALATPGGDGAGGGPAGHVCESGAADLRDSGIVSTGNLGDTSPGAAGYVSASGTSFAAPAVAAVASLMWAVNPGLTLAQIEHGLTLTARPHVAVPLLGACAAHNPGRCACTTATCGAGLLDADQALAYAAAPAAYVLPVRTAVTLADDKLRACALALGPVVEPVPTPAPVEAGGGGGGGASSAGFTLLLALAVLLLAKTPTRRPDGARAAPTSR